MGDRSENYCRDMQPHREVSRAQLKALRIQEHCMCSSNSPRASGIRSQTFELSAHTWCRGQVMGGHLEPALCRPDTGIGRKGRGLQEAGLRVSTLLLFSPCCRNDTCARADGKASV